MPVAPESPRRPTSAHAAHLQYPTLPPLSASVEEWLSRSRPANNMTSSNLDEMGPGSLSESWATLSVSDIHSEDGNRSEQTDVGSLIDQATPDDVASLDERYSGSEIGAPEDFHQREEDDDNNDHADDQEIGGSRLFPQPLFHPGAAIDDSNLTAQQTPRQSIDSIEFAEPETWADEERVELKHTISILNEDVTSVISKPSTPGSVIIVTVQQTMTKQTLDLDKPFRVLYFGNPEFRDIILDKIGDVLVSSPSAGSLTSSAESSRYHVVPTSFGTGAVPNHAELLPINVQLVVDECVEAAGDLHPDQPTTVDLTFKNRPSCRSWWDKDHYRVSSTSEWTLPNLAILFISKRDDPAAIHGRRLAHAFLERHRIPSMIISDEQLWTQEDYSVPLNPNSLHMCLESRNAQTGESTILKRYPIDVKTFESITPGQLNRNLASLIDLHQGKASVRSDRKYSAHNYPSWMSNGYRSWYDGSWFDIEKYPGSWLQPIYARGSPELGPTLRLLTLTLVSAIAISLGSTLSHSILPSSTPAVPTATLVLEGLNKDSLSVRPPGHVGLVKEEPSSLSLVDQVAELTITSFGSTVDPDAFEIHGVGDCHILIKSPPGGVPLTNELSQLFEGVYTVRLDREDAHGLVNVTVTGRSKPSVQQSEIIDFGTPWLKISNWRKKAQSISSQVTKDLHVAQNGLSDVYGRLSTDVQVILGDVVKRAHYIKEDAERLHQETSQTRKAILHRSKQRSDAIVTNTLQHFQSMYSILRQGSIQINREVFERVSNAWTGLENPAPKADLASAVDRVRNATKIMLGRCQMRARYLLGRPTARNDANLECPGQKATC
ncbi:hypothetical protein N7470_008375 [Penicillium chermesinum]|nr:hypothetical protein N7470_008375 [Penicillium chermesinum]